MQLYTEKDKSIQNIQLGNLQSQVQKIIIYDVEDNSGSQISVNFRIMKNLDGFSQIIMNNCLYLCGANLGDNSSGSYLFKFDPNNRQWNNTTVLISSINYHHYPTLITHNDEFLIVIGGIGSTSTEVYNTNTNKWKGLADLPEERYRCSGMVEEITDFVYLFGGYNSKTDTNAMSVLRMNLKQSLIWETLVIKTNSHLLARNSCAILVFNRGNSVYLLGGISNDKNNTDSIVEFEIYTRNVSLSRKKLDIESSFIQQTGTDFNKNDFFFFDEIGNIHKILGKDFQVLLGFHDEVFKNYV